MKTRSFTTVLHEKKRSSLYQNKVKITPASFSLNGQVTKHTTVKCPICSVRHARSSQNDSFNWLKKQVEMNYTNNAHIPKKILGHFFMQGR